MSETPSANTPVSPMHEDPSSVVNQGEALPESYEAACGGYLERRGINPADVPRRTMTQREFALFGITHPEDLEYVLELFEIPQSDQDNCRYVLVDVMPDDRSQPPAPKLTVVTEVDFGTTIDRETIDRDFQQSTSGSNDPLTPNSGGAVQTVNIAEAIATSTEGLKTFASELMKGRTDNPFSISSYTEDSIGVRAGDLAPGQPNAYVWTASPITRSVELTIAFPSQYDSVCVVRGQRREAANGKAGMAQIENPTEVFKIEGERLEELKTIYRELYSEPHYALTEPQKRERDALLENLVHLISDEAGKNRARAEEEYRRRHQPQLRARETPGSRG